MSDDDSEGNDTHLQMDPHFVVDIVEQRVRILQNRPDENDDNYVCLEKISVEEYETFGQLWTDDTGYEYDDDYIFCEHPDCETYYFGSCREHPLFLVKDRESNRNGLRARNTIPAFLRIKKSEMPNAGLGVYANTFIPIGIVFGPFEGVLVNDESKVERDGYAWQIRGKDPNNSLFLDASDEHYSNWMRYINSPYDENEQNIVAFQYNGAVYYRVIRPITANEELLVWYGDSYGKCIVAKCRQKSTRRIGHHHIPIEKNPFVRY
ncbi:hypothetical protein WR25_05904 [Diploscapter pachys]|uniref:SET domain-containing protein n=1 Tax=Diploscapter pachys TaxID=2018661 RepID=A0A2A2KF71_9BILA|nr:hypothetical protein WR25_05904 [Diploscapter pachys]